MDRRFASGRIAGFTVFSMVLAIVCAGPTAGTKYASEALRNRSEGFEYAAEYLDVLDMQNTPVIPNGSTLLVPTDAALRASGLIYSTLGAASPTLKYHVVTKQLSFTDLQQLPVGAMLPTMLPNASLLITSKAPNNFTVNDVLLAYPDIYCSMAICMHGMDGVLNLSHLPTFEHTSLPPPVPLTVPTSTAPPTLTLPLPEMAAPSTLPLPVSLASVTQKYSLFYRVGFISIIFAASQVLSLCRRQASATKCLSFQTFNSAGYAE